MNADGSVVRYVALADNRRVDAQTKPDMLMNLGPVDQVDVEGCAGWPPRSTSMSGTATCSATPPSLAWSLARRRLRCWMLAQSGRPGCWTPCAGRGDDEPGGRSRSCDHLALVPYLDAILGGAHRDVLAAHRCGTL